LAYSFSVTVGNMRSDATLKFKSNERIVSLDVIRGFALCGILLINICFAGLIRVFDVDAIHFKESNPKDFYAWFIVYVFFEGKMRCLFSMLFGAGIVLFTSKTLQPVNTADAYFRRMMWLLAFGLADSLLLLWMGDILYQYALCGMLIYVFRNLPAKHLTILALCCIVYLGWKSNESFAADKRLINKYDLAVKILLENKPLSNEQRQDVMTWSERQKNFYPFNDNIIERYRNSIELNINNKQQGYSKMFKQRKKEVVYIHSILFYQTFWETLSSMFMGMALLKIGFFTGGFAKKKYLQILAICMLIGLPLSYLIVSRPYSFAARYYTYYLTHNPFDLTCYEQIPRFLIAIAYASALMLLCMSGKMKRLITVLAAVGRMAFSNYILQSVFYMILFYGCGFALFGSFSRLDLYGICILMWVFHITFSTLWLKYFSYGPLEWLWRSLTFLKWYPFVKQKVI